MELSESFTTISILSGCLIILTYPVFKPTMAPVGTVYTRFGWLQIVSLIILVIYFFITIQEHSLSKLIISSVISFVLAIIVIKVTGSLAQIIAPLAVVIPLIWNVVIPLIM